jgi:hypothetical protein
MKEKRHLKNLPRKRRCFSRIETAKNNARKNSKKTNTILKKE